AAPGAGAVDRYEVTFFNPVTLTWLIPGTDGHDHPNSPGVDVHGDGYLFLKNQGYRDFAYQNSYYLPLAEYVPPANIDEIRRRLSDSGLRICRYDPGRHRGLHELFDDLGTDDWRRIVDANYAPDGPHEPVLIVEDGARVCGFTGPLHVQPSGRGYFAGIGVHSDYRGRGAAKALFSALCGELAAMGASFMSLFTGETNPARNIYEAAGFRIVRCWADMRKEIRP
ncbi:MAG: N-acetyltransferase family protein, partial [Spirochaetota bacterium]